MVFDSRVEQTPPLATSPGTGALSISFRILFSAATAFLRPARSRAASLGPGGPKDLVWRYGRLQRSTVNPAAAKASAKARSSGAWALPPAPCVRTRPLPFGTLGVWRNPRTCGSSAVSTNSRMDVESKASFYRDDAGSDLPNEESHAANRSQRFFVRGEPNERVISALVE